VKEYNHLSTNIDYIRLTLRIGSTNGVNLGWDNQWPMGRFGKPDRKPSLFL